MKYFTFLVLLISTSLSSQEYLTPIEANSFGLNNHTNRDVSYFTKVDNSNSIVNVSTTERDSTYTDILISKFDADLNLSWQKRHSINTGLSYDIPLDLYLDSNNNIIVVGKSSFKQSNRNGLIFVIKYNALGNILWEKTLGNIDGFDYYDYSFYSSSFENDALRIVYAKFHQGIPIPINYITIDDSGNITETLTSNFRIDGAISVYKNGIYYTFVRVDEDDGNYNDQFYLIKKNQTSETIYHLNYLDNFAFENFSPVIDYYKINVDNEENIYLVKTKEEGNGFITYTKVNALGEIEFTKQIPENQNYIGSKIDENNSLNLIFYNQLDSSISQKVIDNNGNESVLEEFNFPNYAGGDLKDNNTLFVINSLNDIILFDQNLTLVNSFKFSNYYELSDIAKLDNSNIVTSGTTYDKMYPESDYLSQRNITLEKIDNIQINNYYLFSGEGTSKVTKPMVMIDNDNNYLILSEEQMGPRNNQIGGSRPPINKSVYKYDSDLNLLWRTEIPHYIFTESNFLIDNDNNLFINSQSHDSNEPGYFITKISPEGNIIFQKLSSAYGAREMHFDKNQNLVRTTWPNRINSHIDETNIYTHNSDSGELISTTTIEGYEFIRSYKAPTGDSYMFFYAVEDPSDNSKQKMRVYKNLDLEFTINLNVTGTNGEIFISPLTNGVDDNGNLFFSSYGGHNDNRIHKVTLSGDYQYQDIENELTRMTVLGNGDLFFMQEITSEDGKLSLFDNDLNLLQEFSQNFFKHSILFEYKDFLFVNDYPFHEYTDYYVNVLNRNGQQIDKFRLPSNLSYAKIDQNTDLILTGLFGNQIYLYTFYGWYRGLLHKYSYDGPLDSDGDGIGDNIDECPDTPNSEQINDTGCSESQLDDDNDGVTNNIDQCPNTPENEPVNENGCGESELDDDGDGITNDLDQCPDSVLLGNINDFGCFYLPSNNFNIVTLSETCPSKKNGQIIINAVENLNYILQINGTDYNFTSTLSINDLAPGNYEMCISVPEESYEQCYNLTIEEGENISGRISSVSNTTTISMNGGTAPFTVFKNNIVILHTWENSFSLGAENGDILEIKTSQECEGSLIKRIGKLEQLIVLPNPTKENIEIIGLSNNGSNVDINVYNIQSQLVLNLSSLIVNNRIQLSLNNLPSGVYFIRFNDEDPITLKIIKE